MRKRSHAGQSRGLPERRSGGPSRSGAAGVGRRANAVLDRSSGLESAESAPDAEWYTLACKLGGGSLESPIGSLTRLQKRREVCLGLLPLIFIALSGCGTISNLAGGNLFEKGPEAFGGIRQNAETMHQGGG